MDKGLALVEQAKDINLNIDQKTLEACLKSVNRFGDTLYMNVCTGQSVSIPTGSFDWFVFFITMFFVIALGVMLIKIIISIFSV